MGAEEPRTELSSKGVGVRMPAEMARHASQITQRYIGVNDEMSSWVNLKVYPHVMEQKNSSVGAHFTVNCLKIAKAIL